MRHRFLNTHCFIGFSLLRGRTARPQSINSTPGQGTTFTIYLPAVRKTISDRSHALVEHKDSGKVMIMDDEEMVRTLTQSMLENCGYEIVHAKNGEEAIVLYKIAMNDAQPIDVVIVDLIIFGGRETISMLKEIGPNITAIVSSGTPTIQSWPILKNMVLKGV